MIAKMIECGAKINATNDLGNTALHHAITLRHDSVIKLLLQKGADLTLLNHKQESCFQMLLRSDDYKKLFYDFAPEETKMEVLYSAVINRAIDFVQAILSTIDNTQLRKGYPNILHSAAAIGNDHMLELILAKDPSLLNAQDQLGQLALHYAIILKRDSVIKILLQKGADLTLLNHKQESCFQMLLRNDDYKKLSCDFAPEETKMEELYSLITQGEEELVKFVTSTIVTPLRHSPLIEQILYTAEAHSKDMLSIFLAKDPLLEQIIDPYKKIEVVGGDAITD